MADTFQLISSVTLSSPASSIDFTSIPSTYTDLRLEFSIRTTNSSSSRSEDAIVLALNNDTTGGNYTVRYLRGAGSGAVGGSAATGYAGAYAAEVNGSTSTANTFTSGVVYLPNYSGSSNKSFSVDVVQEAAQITAYAQLHACLWSNTAAINRISFSNYNSNTFATNTKAYLYGIKKS